MHVENIDKQDEVVLVSGYGGIPAMESTLNAIHHKNEHMEE